MDLVRIGQIEIFPRADEQIFASRFLQTTHQRRTDHPSMTGHIDLPFPEPGEFI
jgi:hypothetical protein